MHDINILFVIVILAVIAGVVLALVWANVDPAGYAAFNTNPLAGPLDLRFLTNDLFMVLFFAIAAAEVTQSCLPGGDLNPPAKALNPLLVMLLIPFNNLVLYPALRRLGVEPTALRRMGLGIALAGAAWVAAGLLQLRLDGGAAVSIAWQVIPYLLLTFGEVLVSATGLEFAYSQAPASMKGTIMSFWSLSVTFGNLWVLVTNAAVRDEAVLARIAATGLGQTAFLMFFFAGFAFLAALAFALFARRYVLQDHYRRA